MLRVCGLIALCLVVGKLLLVDVSQLEAVWRVLLFMGFGAIFLVLSYLFPSLWNIDTLRSAGVDSSPEGEDGVSAHLMTDNSAVHRE